MNKDEIIKYIMNKIRRKADDCLEELNRPSYMKTDLIKKILKDIQYLAKMIMEE